MERTKVRPYARALYEAHGDRAEAEAAQKATRLEQDGDTAGAETWRAVQLSVKEIRGARQG